MPRLLPQSTLWLLPLIVIAALYYGGCWLQRRSTLPFRHLRFTKHNQHMPQQPLEQLIWQHLNGGFFSLKTKALQKALQQQPWIAHFAIRKLWPDTLELTIDEKKPIARWGQNGILSDQASVFYPAQNTIPQQLPLVIASIDQRHAIVAFINATKNDLSTLRLKVRKMTVQPPNNYRVILNNGVKVILGDEKHIERFHRFALVYAKVKQHQQHKISQVDLRYTHGFAVQ